MNIGQHLLLLVIRAYRKVLSPVLGFLAGPYSGCRYTPTCSVYAMAAIQTHGAVKGAWLGLKRICRCHPWGGCGHDPVPPKTGAPNHSVHSLLAAGKGAFLGTDAPSTPHSQS